MASIGKKLAGFALALGVAAFLTPASAKAVFVPTLEVEFKSGIFTTTAIDNTAFDSDPTIGVINFVGTINGITINATVASSNSPGAATLASVGMSSGQLKNTGAGAKTLSIFTSSIDFVAPSPPLQVNSSASITVNGLSGGTVDMDFTSYVDGSNAFFGTAHATDTLSLHAPPGASRSDNAAPLDVATIGTPYSVSNLAVYTLPGSAFVDGSSGTTNVFPTTVIPGPGGLVLALAGLPFLGGAWLRRRKS